MTKKWGGYLEGYTITISAIVVNELETNLRDSKGTRKNGGMVRKGQKRKIQTK